MNDSSRLRLRARSEYSKRARSRKRLVLGVVTLLLASAAPCSPSDADEPPLVHQPPLFSGAVGNRFKVEAQAEPTEIQAADWLHYRLRITSVGPAKRPPSRPDLRQQPAFEAGFQIQDLASADRAWKTTEGEAWEFVYRLRPRRADVKHIPPFRFVYYRPGFLPRAKGYQTNYSRSIEITIRAPAAETPVKTYPAQVYQLADGPVLFRREQPPALPGALVLLTLALVPPVLCGCWFLVWRSLYPDAARAARRRRSKAARTALQTLRAGRGEDAEARARRSAAALATYLWQRLDVPLADATPAQADERLRRLGFPAPLTEQVADLFRSCDAARFARGLVPAEKDLSAVTEKLILTLESEPWLSPLS